MPTNSATEAKPEQTGVNRGFVSLTFPVSADSPFPDGYDIASERDALADLIAAETPDESDTRFSRFVLLREREAQLRQLRASEKLRPAGETSVPDHVRRAAMEVGQLVDEERDTMTLHTKEAYRVFTGRWPLPEGRIVHIAGGKRFAAVLKSIWDLSANDNPYADWLLIMMHDRLSDLRSKIESVTTEKQGLIEHIKAQGLSFSVLKSSRPKIVELGFRSPYGYATADVIVVFDYYVRMVKTLVRKDRMSDAEGRQAIRQAGHQLRALFLEPVQWERFLLGREMSALCRADFLSTAADEGKERVKTAVARFGKVPRSILAGTLVPRHTQRWVKLSQSELRAIAPASLHTDNSSDGDESPLL